MKTDEEKNIENKDLTEAEEVLVDSSVVLGYTDTVSSTDPSSAPIPTGNGSATITIDETNKIQLFWNKIPHSKAGSADINNDDYIGFTLVYGNTGTLKYTGKSPNPTLTDKLDLRTLDPSIKLTLVDLCINDCYQLVSDNATSSQGDDAVLDPCSAKPAANTFMGGKLYTLTLQKCTNCKYKPFTLEKTCTSWTSFFDINCQSICCISMLFRIDPADPCNCNKDCCLDD